MKKSTKKQKFLAIPFAVFASLALATSAFAAEVDNVKVSEPTPIVEKVEAETPSDAKPVVISLKTLAERLNSNDDTERRDAVKESFKVELSDSDRWEDKKGQYSLNQYGSKFEYTSHEQLKALNIYAVNANRQELIQYSIRTDDWQPYRAFEAQKTPAYFEVVDGKLEYNKIFYGHIIGSMIRSYNQDIADHYGNAEKRLELEKQRKEYIESNVKKFNEAPGIVPSVFGLNHDESTALETGAKVADKGYFDSKYNHPDVMSKGVFDPAKVKAEEEEAKKAEEAKKLEESKKAEEAKKLEEAKKAEEAK